MSDRVRRSLAALLAGEVPPPPADWQAFAREAGRHGLEVSLLHALRPVLPEDALLWLDRRTAAVRAQDAVLLGELRDTLAAFAADGIVSAPLKGPILGHRFYEPPFSRPSTDLDVLLSPRDMERARTLMLARGYRPLLPHAEDYYRAHHHHFPLIADGRPMVELHFHAQSSFGARIPADTLLERSREATVAGIAVRLLDPHDEFAYLAAHAAAHRFSRIGWLYDLTGLARAHGLTADGALERARALGVRRATLTALLELADVGVVLPGGVPASRRGRAALRLRGPRGRLVDTAYQVATELLLADDLGAARRVLGRALTVELPRRLMRVPEP